MNRRTTIIDDYNAPGAFADGRDLPFLEQPADGTVWSDWGIRYRDVVVLDADNEVVGIINLTDDSLAEPDNQDALLDIIFSVANPAGGVGGSGGRGGGGGGGGGGRGVGGGGGGGNN
ncbi:MAG: hypothetical protein AAGN82_27280 [Myxococcota bacterium]